MTPGTSMWAQRCGILPRPVAPARSHSSLLPSESNSGAPTSQLSPPTRLTSLSPPRSTGEAPALPHQRNPPPEIPRQAVRRQPAEDRLVRRQGASPPPRQLPDLISRNGTRRKSRCSPPLPSLTRLFPPIIPSAPRGLPRQDPQLASRGCPLRRPRQVRRGAAGEAQARLRH